MTTGAPPASAAATVPLSRRRFEALEGLRGLAAIAVFFQHMGFWTGATFNTRFGGLLSRLDWGVPVFFAISGFLLFRAPAEALLDPTDSTSQPDLRTFWRRRVWRVYPAYLAVLAIVMVWPRDTPKPSLIEMPLHILLLQIYPTDTFFEGISQAWSLSVEISFYLLLPFLGRALQPWMNGKAVSARAVRLLGVMAGLVAFSTFFRAMVFATTDGDAFRAVFWLPGTIDYFAIGMSMAIILAWADRRPIGQEIVAALKTFQTGWWVMALVPYLIMAYGLDLDVGLGRSSWHLELLRQACTWLVGAMLVLPAVFVDYDRPRLSFVERLLNWGPVQRYGTISFSFYLWHLAVIETMFRWTDNPQFLNWGDGTPYAAILTIGISSFAISCVLAYPTYKYVEVPTMRRSRS